VKVPCAAFSAIRNPRKVAFPWRSGESVRERRSADLRDLSAAGGAAMIAVRNQMSTLQEIKSAIEHLNAHDKALLTAELFAMNAEPDEAALEAALERGLRDVEASRVRPIEEVKAMISRWTSKS